MLRTVYPIKAVECVLKTSFYNMQSVTVRGVRDSGYI